MTPSGLPPPIPLRQPGQHHHHGPANQRGLRGRGGRTPVPKTRDPPVILAVHRGRPFPDRLSMQDFFAERGLTPGAPMTGQHPADGLDRAKTADLVLVGNTCGVNYALAEEAEIAGLKAGVFGQITASQHSGPLLWGFSKILAEADVRLTAAALIDGRIATDYHSLPHRAPRHALLYHGSDLRTGYAVRKLPAFVTTRDLLSVHPGSVLLRRPVSERLWKPDPAVAKAKEEYKSRLGIEAIVGHFPTDRQNKGSAAIDAAVRKSAKAKSWEYVTLAGPRLVPVWDLPKVFAWCDYVIDWVNPDFGIHGLISIQAAFCGAVAIASVDPQKIDSPDLEGAVLDARTADAAVELITRGEKPGKPSEALREFYGADRAFAEFRRQMVEWGLMGGS